MVRLLSVIIVILAFQFAPLSAAEFSKNRVTGFARVSDGDTLKIAGERLRIFGIDAPERNQSCRTEHGVVWKCGIWASESLKELVEGEQVSCIWDHRDSYGRPIVQCQIEGKDLGGMLVENGIALAYRKYSTRYVEQELSAARKDIGLWAGSVQQPQTFRLIAQKSEEPPSKACAIKGNISKSGRIYHIPGSKWYSRTKIDQRRGERWFCSIKDAVKAGWRAPRG